MLYVHRYTYMDIDILRHTWLTFAGLGPIPCFVVGGQERLGGHATEDTIR